MERGDFVFYDRFLELCRRKGVVPTRAAVEAGISKSLVSKWKANEAKEPSPEVVRKLSEYFGVSPYEVLEDLPCSRRRDSSTSLPAGRGRPTLTERERRDVAREVERIMGDLENSGDLMFDGVPMSPEARDSLTAAMKLGLEAARLRNKETYTPKKYRGPKEEA